MSGKENSFPHDNIPKKGKERHTHLLGSAPTQKIGKVLLANNSSSVLLSKHSDNVFGVENTLKAFSIAD
jgi:hypothetical protein